MYQPPFEVADVIRTLAAVDGRVPGLRVSQAQQRVIGDLAACRTAKLGGHVDACDACGEVRVSYNSCRNRHCPKCQAHQRATWLEDRCQDLLPVPYFHLVFTLPAELAPLALQNKREIYAALFAAAADTLKTIAADPKHLGADIGFIAVLHTWGQALVHHPHLHCVIPGGGFVRIRHYGFLANRARKQKLPLCRQLIAQATGHNISTSSDLKAALEAPDDDGERCPACHAGIMRRTQTFDPQPSWEFQPLRRGPPDTA